MLAKPDNKIIIGKTGSGKSIKALNLVKDCTRVLIFDTLGHDYSDGVCFYDMNTLKAWWRTVHDKSFRIIYRPLDEIAEFEEICKLCWACRDMSVLIEEMDIFCQYGRTPFSFIQLLKRGRHRDIHLVGVTQRPVGVDKNVTAMATEIYVFETNEPRDLDYLKERLSAEAVEQIKTLQAYQWLKWTNSNTPIEIGKETL